MNRCASRRRRAVLAHGLLASVAPLLMATSVPAAAQVTRHFPMNALRGELTLLSTTEVLLNGEPARLAPGGRLRGQNNMLVVSGAAIGQRMIVNYTVDSLGNVKDVWILRPEEIANWPWPRTVQEAQTWGFNFDTQIWIKP